LTSQISCPKEGTNFEVALGKVRARRDGLKAQAQDQLVAGFRRRAGFFQPIRIHATKERLQFPGPDQFPGAFEHRGLVALHDKFHQVDLRDLFLLDYFVQRLDADFHAGFFGTQKGR